MPPLPTHQATTSHSSIFKRIFARRIKFIAYLALVMAILGGGFYYITPQWVLGFMTWQKAYSAGLSTHHLKAGDTDFAYYEGGEGPTLVLIHGYGSNRNIWLPITKKLTENFHLVIPDMPGWGDSSRLEKGDYRIERQAQRLGQFLDEKNISRPMLVGHSLGGAISGYYASEHPDKVGSLVLMDSFGITFDKNGFAKNALKGKNPFIFDNRKQYQQTADLVFSNPPDVPARFIDVFVKSNKANRDFLNKVFDLLRKPEQYEILDDRLDKLTMPVMGLWCQDDKVIDVSALDTLRNGLTHSPAISASVIQSCGHTPQMEKPEAVARILSGYAIGH